MIVPYPIASLVSLTKEGSFSHRTAMKKSFLIQNIIFNKDEETLYDIIGHSKYHSMGVVLETVKHSHLILKRRANYNNFCLLDDAVQDYWNE